MAGQVEMVFFDVKYGNSTYIKSPNGKHIVIDLGKGSLRNKNEDFSPLLHLQSKCNVSQLDYVIITHPHKDHIADIMNFVELVPKVLCNPFDLTKEEIINDKISNSDMPFYERYLAINEYYGLKWDEYKRSIIPANFGDLKIDNIHLKYCPTPNINNHSLITVFEYATIKVIITGDNETACLKELIKKPPFVEIVKNADILLAPYHGREAGFCKEFVKIVNPRITVISDSRYREKTSKREWYAENSRGWTVLDKNENCTCPAKTLSTYYHGIITITFGWNDANKPFLHISRSLR
jgi:competence protein ComEC